MAVEESRIITESPVVGISPWLLLMRDEIRQLGAPLVRSERDDTIFEIRHGGGSLWIFTRWPSGACVAFCAAYALAGTSGLKESTRGGSSLEVRLDTVFGEYSVRVDLPGRGSSVLHWKTSLIPATDLTIPSWPRDVLPLDPEDNPLGTRGIVHATQRGPAGGLLYASVTRPSPGSFLYMQNLTALNDYFEQTRSSPADRVGGG